MFWGLGSVADLLVPVALGDEWRPAILPLMAFAWVAPLRLMGSIESPAMTGMGRPEVLVRTKLFLATVMIGSLAVACAWYGVVGAIFVWVVVFPVCYVATLRVVLSALDLTIGRAFQVVRGPLCSGLIMVVAVRALLVAVEPRGTTTGLLGVAIIVGALVYIGALRVLDPLAFSLTAGRLSRVAGLQPGR